MQYLSFDLRQFIDYLVNKTCICFGAGLQGLNAIYLLENWGMSEKLKFYIDNNPKKWNTNFEVENYSYPIVSIEQARQLLTSDMVLLITCQDVVGVKKQLEAETEFSDIPCVSLAELGQQQMLVSLYDKVIRSSDKPLIPKKIHYCWFGNPMPKLMRDNVDKWKRLCPDYEIIRWNEKNYDVTKVDYIREAYERKAWGFVSDYIRLDVIYQHGGIYMDTDVELLKRPDALLYQNAFAISDSTFFVNIGAGFGSRAEEPLIRAFRDMYHDEHFIDKRGKINNFPCIIYQYRVLRKYGIRLDDSLQSLDGFNIYPMIMASTAVRSLQMRLSEMAFFAHYGTMTWMNAEHLQRRQAMSVNQVEGLINYAL